MMTSNSATATPDFETDERPYIWGTTQFGNCQEEQFIL